MKKTLPFLLVILLNMCIVLLLPVFPLRAQGPEAQQTLVDSLARELAQLKLRLQKLELQEKQAALEKLRQKAREHLQRVPARDQPEDRQFVQGASVLSAFNPEISLVGDQFFVFGRNQSESAENMEEVPRGFTLRVFEINFRSNLDPFSTARATVELSEEGIEVSEAYVLWTNVLHRINLTAGRFRQRLGVVNRWHEDALDQVFRPLVIQEFFGEEGVAQLGFGLDWLLPAWGNHASEITLQFTNPENEKIFSGEVIGLPTALVHWKNFFDLSPASYLEFGLSGMVGQNDSLGFTLRKDHTWSWIGALDATYSWAPPGKARYRGLTWRNEWFFVRKEQWPGPARNGWGGFSYLDYRLNRRWVGGVRLDLVKPLEREREDQLLWQLTPYLTFWQSEFVFLRMEFQHLQARHAPVLDNRFLIQLNWVVGPHRHEKY